MAILSKRCREGEPGPDSQEPSGRRRKHTLHRYDHAEPLFAALAQVYAGRYKVGDKLQLEGEGAREPIIDRQLWLRVPSRLLRKGPSSCRRKNARDEFPLQVSCATPGAAAS